MIGQTLYAKYIEEREGAKIIENASGFLTYRIMDREAFILNLYIDSKLRKKGLCRELISILEQKALEEKCEVITGFIQINDPGKNNTMMAALSIGFEIAAANEKQILILKKINGGN